MEEAEKPAGTVKNPEVREGPYDRTHHLAGAGAGAPKRQPA